MNPGLATILIGAGLGVGFVVGRYSAWSTLRAAERERAELDDEIELWSRLVQLAQTAEPDVDTLERVLAELRAPDDQVATPLAASEPVLAFAARGALPPVVSTPPRLRPEAWVVDRGDPPVWGGVVESEPRRWFEGGVEWAERVAAAVKAWFHRPSTDAATAAEVDADGVDSAAADEVDEPRAGIAPLANPQPELDSHILVVVDEHGCAVPCVARHCPIHRDKLGTVAQRHRSAEQQLVRAAFNTATAEWRVLAADDDLAGLADQMRSLAPSWRRGVEEIPVVRVFSRERAEACP